jgi:hypothetical protein
MANIALNWSPILCCVLREGMAVSTLPESWAQIAEKVKNWRLFVMTSETPKI